MIRPLADIGRWLEELVSLPPQVRFGVDQARQAGKTRTASELGPAAADAAGTGPGAPADVPAPGQPDRADQIDSVAALLYLHRCTWFPGLPGGRSAIWSCNGCMWESESTAAHERHLSELVVDMLRADARMSSATNKFRK